MKRTLSVVLALVLAAGAMSPVGASTQVGDGCVQELAGWGSVQGRWTSGCEAHDSSTRYAQFFTFSLDRETSVRTGFEHVSQEAQVYLFRGHDLRSAEELGSSLWGFRKTLPAGDYMIEVTTYYHGRTGAFTLLVTEDVDPVPAVHINGGIGPRALSTTSVTEGRSAVFTLWASPPPSVMLPVSVWVSQHSNNGGDYGVETRIEEVIIPPSGSATLTVATADDDVDEARGWVQVGIRVNERFPYWHSGHGTHDVVWVYDNDPPRPPPPPPTAVGSVVSVAAGSGVTEGGDASFTVTADPAPSQPLTVNLTVSQVGDHGAATGARTVTVGTGGSATVTVSTSDDEVHEPDGSVSVSVDSGSGYTVSSTQGSAAVGVADDDVPAACPTVVALAAQALANRDALPDDRENWLERYRWRNVWIALAPAPGTSDGPAFAVEARLWALDDARWTPFADAMACLESVPPWGGPVVSVAAGSGVIEGGDASFTVSADPAPSQPLTVRLTVGQWGRFGAATGSRTVTIPTSGSATVTVSTSDDKADEPDGSVSVTVDSGDGYNVSAPQGTAVVDVADDDDESLPFVSVTAGAGVVEGANAEFTVFADPAPSQPLSVNLTVGQVGHFGAATGARTITVPTSGSATVTVSTSDDAVAEADGSVTVDVQGGTGYTASFPRRATVAVSDDDGPFVPPQISIAAGADVTEGGAASFTVSASPAPAVGLDVTVAVTQRGDFAVSEGSRTVTVPATGSVDFTVSTSDDSAEEPDGSVTASVQDGYGYAVSATGRSASVGITSDDAAPVDACVTALTGSGTVHAVWDRTCESKARSGRSARFFTFSLDAQATVKIDLSSHHDTYLYLRRGLNRRTTRGEAHDDDGGPGLNSRIVRTLDAGDYTIEATTYRRARVGKFTLTTTGIADQASASTTEISVTADGDITEGADAAFTVSASPAPSAPLSVVLAVGQVGAFGAATGSRTVTVPTSGTVSVTVGTSDDDMDEPDGSVNVSVDAGSGYTVSSSQGSASVVVADDDDPPSAGCGSADVLAAQARANHDALPNTAANRKERNDWWRAWIALSGTTGTYNTPLTAAEARVLESGDPRWTPFRAALECLEGAPPTVLPEVSVTAGSGVTEGADASFTVTADPAPTQPLQVSVSVTQSGDFGATTGSRTVTVPTSGSATVTVSTSDDDADEPDGSVNVSVDAGSGYTVSSAHGSASVAVADDDDPPPAEPVVSVTAGSGVTEGADASFTVSASPAPAQPLTVSVTVVQSGDFGAATGTQTVTVGTGGTATVTVSTSDDDEDEADGSVSVTVANGSGYTVSGTQGSATVNVADDDDPPPVVSVTAGSGVTEGADAQFTVSASPAPSAPLQVSVSVSQSGDFGASTGSRTVTVGSGGTATVTVSTSDDDADEPGGSVSVAVADGSGYTVSSTSGSASVVVADDDDPLPTDLAVVSVSDASVAEGELGWLSPMEFRLALSRPSDQNITVRYRVRLGTTSPSDHYGGGGRATIWAGRTHGTIVVLVADDTRREGEEALEIELTGADGAAIDADNNTATGTITDND